MVLLLSFRNSWSMWLYFSGRALSKLAKMDPTVLLLSPLYRWANRGSGNEMSASRLHRAPVKGSGPESRLSDSRAWGFKQRFAVPKREMWLEDCNPCQGSGMSPQLLLGKEWEDQAWPRASAPAAGAAPAPQSLCSHPAPSSHPGKEPAGASCTLVSIATTGPLWWDAKATSSERNITESWALITSGSSAPLRTGCGGSEERECVQRDTVQTTHSATP
jgi:hypothetical protein